MSNNLTLNIEHIKKEKDGLDVLSDIYIYAVLGEKPTSKDLIRFQWYGIYQQEENSNYFKIVIPLPLGELNVEQLKTLASISKEYARNSLDINHGQKIEFKWLKMHDLPHIFNLLHNVNLNTIFEAGHTVRSIITCPINTVDCKQLIDVSSIANKINQTFIGNKKFSNLPNKLQMAISGCKEGCNLEETPDVNFDAYSYKSNKILFSVKITGEHIGYITPSQVIQTSKAVANIYKEYGNRTDINKSSFASLVKSWGLKEFNNILNSSINFSLKELILEEDNVATKGEHFGINKSTIEGESYIGFKVKSLALNSNDFSSLAKILEKHDASKIKLTNQGNIIILDAPTNNADKLANDLKKVNFNPFI
ncbi:MAG: sulfite reductase [Poseidonibacter sp.]